MLSKRVDSSVIHSIGYDERRRLLRVRFHNGRTYSYLGVEPLEYRALLASPSIGKYFNEVIKPAHRAVRERDLSALTRSRARR
jgi:hypothetical protein